MTKKGSAFVPFYFPPPCLSLSCLLSQTKKVFFSLSLSPSISLLSHPLSWRFFFGNRKKLLEFRSRQFDRLEFVVIWFLFFGLVSVVGGVCVCVCVCVWVCVCMSKIHVCEYACTRVRVSGWVWVFRWWGEKERRHFLRLAHFLKKLRLHTWKEGQKIIFWTIQTLTNSFSSFIK